MLPYQAIFVLAWFTVAHEHDTDFKIIANYDFYSRHYLFSQSILSSFRDCTCNQKTSTCTLNTKYKNESTWLVSSIKKHYTEQIQSKLSNNYICRGRYSIVCERIEQDNVEDDTPLFFISDRSCRLFCVGIAWNVGISQTTRVYKNTPYLFLDTSSPGICTSALTTPELTSPNSYAARKTSTKTLSSFGVSTNFTTLWLTAYTHQQNRTETIKDDETNKTPIIIGITVAIVAFLAAIIVVGYISKRRKCCMIIAQRHRSRNSEIVQNELNTYSGESQDRKEIGNNSDYCYETITSENDNGECKYVVNNSRHDYQNAFVSISKLYEIKSNNFKIDSKQQNITSSQMFVSAMDDDLQQAPEHSNNFNIIDQKSDWAVSGLEDTYSNVHDQEYFILEQNYSDGIHDPSMFAYDVSHPITNNEINNESTAISTTAETNHIYSKLGEQSRDFRDTYNTKSDTVNEALQEDCLNGDENPSSEYSLAAASNFIQTGNNHHITSDVRNVEFDKISSE